jgi:hypothetical protein
MLRVGNVEIKQPVVVASDPRTPKIGDRYGYIATTGDPGSGLA